MQRLPTTVVAVVGDASEPALAAAGGGANTRVVPPGGDPVATWAQVVRTRRPFCLVGDDPLAEVAAAWTDLFDRQQATGRLEVAVTEVLQRIRAGALDLPDFYVVAGEAPFHLAALQPAAPARVVPVEGDVARTVSRLRAGRWWPSPEVLLADLDRRLPDAFQAAAEPGAEGGGGLVALGGP